MTEVKHKEQTRGWALVAQQLAVAIHERRAAPARAPQPVRWYPQDTRCMPLPDDLHNLAAPR